MGEGRKQSAGPGTQRPLPPSQDGVKELDLGPRGYEGMPAQASCAGGLSSGGGVCDGLRGADCASSRRAAGEGQALSLTLGGLFDWGKEGPPGPCGPGGS